MARRNGTSRDDLLNGTNRDDVIHGFGGDDTIHGRDGIDFLYGDDGDDVLFGDAGQDDLSGGAGRDTLDGTGEEEDCARYDVYEGPSGVVVNLKSGKATDGHGDKDTLISIEKVFGSSHDDKLLGGNRDNDDYEGFSGFAGRDTIDGGRGWDEVRYDRDTWYGGNRGVVVDLGKGRATDGFGDVDTLKNIEGVRGSMAGDKLTGSKGDDWFRGLAGRDTIDGGKGIDEVQYRFDAERGGNAGVTVDLQKGRAVDGFGDVDKLKSIENVQGSNFDDTLIGSKGDNVLIGAEGDDLLKGGKGDDFLQGERYVEAGGTGDDTLDGGKGDDLLWGGAGEDELIGGAGRDTFLLDGQGADRISDFRHGTDLIGSSAAALGLEPGDKLAKSMLVFSEAAVGKGPTLIYDKLDGALLFDADGKGGEDPTLIAELHGAPVLTVSDFVLV